MVLNNAPEKLLDYGSILVDDNMSLKFSTENCLDSIPL